MNQYETEKLLHEYLLFHYGTEVDIFGEMPGPREALGFPKRCVDELLDASLVPAGAVALDIGCAVGRSAFELTRFAKEVHALDYSASFIKAAKALKSKGSLPARKVEEGDRVSSFTAEVPEGLAPDQVDFQKGDAMNLPKDLPEADIVLAANLICRLTEPKKFLDRLPSLVRPGGQLLLTTPFTWGTEYTPRENWLGASAEETSFAALSRELEPHFTLAYSGNLPFVIREHARKFQYTVALGSRWIRR